MSKSTRIDFEQIAQAALAASRRLLVEWLPGGDWNGNEYKPLNPTRDDRVKGSFVINAATGKWIENATGDKGGDLISLFAYIRFISQKDAAMMVAGIVGIDVDDRAVNQPIKSAPKAKKLEPVSEDKKDRTNWVPILPAPHDAPPPPVAHYVRGKPQSIFVYNAAADRVNGYVYRFVTSDGGKETLPVCYARNQLTGECEWRWMAFPEPRPLYHLSMLADYPDAPVLLVEGEKCALAAQDKMPFGYVVVTWPGGTKAVHKVDWSPLVGRKIFAWADCDAQRRKLTQAERVAGLSHDSVPLLPESDQPGMRAMREIRNILAGLDPNLDFYFVDIPKPGEKPAGWDIADAIDEGMSADQLLDFIERVRVDEPKKQQKATVIDDGNWKSRLLVRNGQITSCIANVYDILQHDVRWQGVMGFNEFSYVITKLLPPPFVGGAVGEWDNNDTVQTAMWLTREYQFAPKPEIVDDAIEALARANGFHPVRNYLESLEWDGTARLDEWLFDYVGAPKTPYTLRVARWYLMGMVARVMEPGVKFDCCLVLEGTQGRRKSSMLRVLAGEWFGDTDLDLHSKDAMGSVRGKWLYEFAELGSLARAEATKQKSFLSRQVDEYRPPFGRRDIRSPRQLVFGGTTNDWAWNKDDTGGRRFWPIECRYDIDCDGLAEARDQLFAEAFVLYKQNKRFWPTSEEQARIFDHEQIKRHQQDGYVDYLAEFINGRATEFSIADAAEHLKIDAARFSRDVQTRIGKALAVLGCKKVERKTRDVRTWYQPPGTPCGTGDTTDDKGGIDAIPF